MELIMDHAYLGKPPQNLNNIGLWNKREDANYQYQEQNTMYNRSSLGYQGNIANNFIEINSVFRPNGQSP